MFKRPDANIALKALRLLRERGRQGMTYDELAEALGVSKNTAKRYAWLLRDQGFAKIVMRGGRKRYVVYLAEPSQGQGVPAAPTKGTPSAPREATQGEVSRDAGKVSREGGY